jgi:DNA-binding beta-propeller fold protein YncE
VSAAGLCVLAGVASAAGGAGTRYAVTRSVPMPGVTGWDYLAVDSGRHTLYLTDSGGLIDYDIDAMEARGTVPYDLEVTGVGLLHAVAIDPTRGHGFLVHEVPASVVAFDLASRRHLALIPTDPGPDAMALDAATDRLFVMSAKVSGVHTVTVIDAATLAVVRKIPLPGRPEFAVTDGTGSLYVNLADRKAIARLDTRTMSVVAVWPLGGCSEPSGLALDIEHARLFTSCDNRRLAMVDAHSGKVLATIPTGEGTDAVGFDPSTGTVFASNGESGTLTVAHEDSPSTLRVLQQLPTAPGARTLAVDARTHNVFLLAGEYGEAPMEPSASNPHRYPLIRAGTARLLVVSPASQD